MSRWIFNFKAADQRKLSDIERADFLRRGSAAKQRGVILAAVSVVLGVLAVVSIVSATSYPRVGPFVVLATLSLFLFAFSRVRLYDDLSLLYKRAARLGTVTRWKRCNPPKTLDLIRSQGITIRCKYPEEAEFEQDVVLNSEGYWKDEEIFENQLAKVCGKEPREFETVGDDGVLLTVEGTLVRRVITARIFWVSDGS